MWIDITHQLSKDWAPWPGDPAFELHFFETKANNGATNIAKLAGSTHIATHVDAPRHVDDKGATVDQLPIDSFIGRATVIEILDTPRIDESILKEEVIEGKIVLFKTQSHTNPSQFPETVPVLTTDAIDFLAQQGVQVIGVDVPSIDPIDSETLENHHHMINNGIFNIENLRLAHVSPGVYDFIGLPLKIVGGDASFIRAVLRPLHSSQDRI